MQSSHLIGLFLAAFMTTVHVTSGLGLSKPCVEGPGLAKCVAKYISGFGNSKNQHLDDLKLHCKLDRELALCTDKALAKCPGDTLKALGRAALSYIVFDRKLRVCPRRYGYWSLYQKLRDAKYASDDDDDDDDEDDNDLPINKNSWSYKINTLLHYSQYSNCARNVNIGCLKKFVKKMKADQNLCANIIFKYECLRASTKTCKARIIQDLLNVFPEEANKVLSVLCTKAQDSG